MRQNLWTVPVVALAAATASSEASGQVLTSRLCSLNYNYVYGAGADVHSGSDNRAHSSLLLSDSDVLSFEGGTSGALPGDPPRPYSAATFVNTGSEYAIAGTLNEIDSISASAESHLVAASSGAGTSVTFSVNPGNSQRFEFRVDHAIDYRLSGSRHRNHPDLGAAVILEAFNGFNWGIVFYSEFLPADQTTFDVSGVLVPGRYRITGTVGGRAFENADNIAGYDFVLAMPGLGGEDCPPDFNGDGFLDFFDYDAFVTCFETGECGGGTADFDGDGFIDFFDLDAFIGAFEAGC